MPHALIAQAGANDPTFNPADPGFGNGNGIGGYGYVHASAMQPDGKTVIGGGFFLYNGAQRSCVARLNPDGTVDASFQPGLGANTNVFAVALQPDGKILIGGNFTAYDGVPRKSIARLNANGSLDTSFDPFQGPSGNVLGLAVQPDGRVVIVGIFSAVNGVPRRNVARLNADGSLDGSFDPAGTGVSNMATTVALQSDGRVLVGGYFWPVAPFRNITRLMPDGTADPSFQVGSGADGSVDDIALQPDGRILIGGLFTDFNGVPRSGIARLNADGSLDNTFDPGTGVAGSLQEVSVLGDGKVLIGGAFTSYNGIQRRCLARLHANGSLDLGFSASGLDPMVYETEVQADGKVVVVGQFFGYMNGVARVLSDGTPDATFNPPGGADRLVQALASMPDGKLVAAGDFFGINGTRSFFLARMLANGQMDGTFQSEVLSIEGIGAIAPQSDGKVMIGGNFEIQGPIPRVRIARILDNGGVDPAFSAGSGPDARVLGLGMQPDGKVLLCGAFATVNGAPSPMVARLNSDGGNDASFNMGTGPDGHTYSISALSGGSVLITGEFGMVNGQPRGGVAKLQANGAVDLNFNTGDGASDRVTTHAVQSDGRILIGGIFLTYNGAPRSGIARINPNGSLDATFNPGSGANGEVRRIEVQSDGKIIIAGSFSQVNGISRNRLARLNADGSLDVAFNPGSGADNVVNATALQPNGKLVIGGDFLSYNSVGRNRLARVLLDGEATITTEVPSGPFCAGQAVTVSFVATGAFASGNQFSAQLSDASGSFASPVVIGSMIGTSSGSIACIIPLNTPFGAGYRIRVVATSPSVPGTINNTALTIQAAFTYYQDLDGDGLGNLTVAAYSCTGPPTGFVENADDCDDSTANITSVGAPCDADPGPEVLAGIINELCECVPAPACSEEVRLLFLTGSVPADLSWELEDLSTGLISHSGDGASYPPGAYVVETLCLPTERCFKLRVTDQGDGADGYELSHVTSSARIIDNRDNLSTGLSTLSGNTESFCLPMGLNRLIYTSCDKYWWRSGEYVVANDDPDVAAVWIPNAPNSAQSSTTGYEFWLFDPNGGYSFRRFRSHGQSDGFGNAGAARACHMKINNWSTANHVPALTLLNIRVRARVNGVDKAWGPACRFMLNEALSQCPPTKLMDIPGNAFVSCGRTRAFVPGQRIHARPVSGANRYQWRFRLPAEGVSIIRTSQTYFLNLGWTNGIGLDAGKTYEVDVRASFDGGTNWCGTADPWGDVCPLTITGPIAPGTGSVTSIELHEPVLRTWPNPSQRGTVRFQLDGVDQANAWFDVELFDALGKQVHSKRLASEDGIISGSVDALGIPPGAYVLMIRAGERIHTSRIMLQH